METAAPIPAAVRAALPAGSACLPTGTRVDVGEWFRRGRVWLAVGDRELILVATGKRPFLERQGYADLGESLYNHTTGELVLAPGAPPRRLKLPPVEARQVLARIHGEEKTNA